MRLHRLSAALATTALVAFASPLAAQDQTGKNLAEGSAAAEGAGVVSKVPTAQALYQQGVADDDALLVLAAAKLMMSVDATDVERGSEQKAREGGATAQDGDGVDAPVSGVDMLAKAKELAAGDDAMLAMIGDVEAEGARGRIGGASRTLKRLPAGYIDYFEIPFYGRRLAEIGIVGDGDADLDLLVTDQNGNIICLDTSPSDQIYCAFTPAWDGYFYVAVENVGRMRNSYFILTN